MEGLVAAVCVEEDGIVAHGVVGAPFAVEFKLEVALLQNTEVNSSNLAFVEVVPLALSHQWFRTFIRSLTGKTPTLG